VLTDGALPDMRIALTTARIEQATCPPGKASIDLWDTVQPGLLLRTYPTGKKTFMAFYRVGSGRKAPQRWDRLGDAAAISLKAAREAARSKLGAVAKGADPAGERRAQAKRDRARLGPALDAYEADLTRRQVVKAKDRMALLRRELKPLGNVDLATISRNDIVRLINGIEQDDRPGAAQDLRKNAAVFLGWAVDQGLIMASPLAGWRRPRRTRAQLLSRPGRALADWELPLVWQAAEAEGWPFGPYFQIVLLTGQRRLETSLMRWRHVDLEAAVWTIPAAVTKSGRTHKVPLAPTAVAVLSGLPRMTSDLVFPGRGGAPMSGWSKRVPAFVGRTGLEVFTLHDLRRTTRTGLGDLGVDRIVCELLLNHAVSDELTAIYDRGDYWRARVEAAGRWADHIVGLVEGAHDKVVRLR
jgi:integrase